jgi:hypothetical protein
MATASTNFVTVACNLPHGLHLEIRDPAFPAPAPADPSDPNPKVFASPKIRHTVKGANAANLYGGYGVTENVPADFFAAWLKEHANSPFVKKGLIFAQERPHNAQAQASEQAAVKSGFEPLDPNKPGPGLEKLKTE